MTKKYILWSFLVLLCSLQHPLEGQIQPAPLKQWASLLSSKTDFRRSNFRQVFNEMSALDSVLKCNVFDQLFQIGNKHNKRFLIRMHYLQGLMSAEFLNCSDLPTGISIAKKGLDMAYELEDPYLVELGNKTMAGLYRLKEDYGMAIMHLRLVIEAQQILGPDDFYNVGFDLYALGELSYYTREYEDCVEYMNQALVLNVEMGINRDDTLDNAAKMYLFNTLGLACLRTQKYELALDAFREALLYAERTGNHEWKFLLQGNMGDVFFELGQYDTARVLLTRDIQKSLAGGDLWLDNAANSLQKMARINIHENKINLARMQLQMADSLLAISPKPSITVKVYYGYLEMYRKLELTDSLYRYSTKYMSLHDSLERKAANERAEIVEVRFSHQENINQILSLTREKKRIALIRNFILLLTLLSSMIGILYINRQRLKMKYRHQQTMDAKNKAEANSKNARQQLTLFTQNVLEKNSLVEKLQEQLLEKELTDLQVQYIRQLSQHAILTDEDWNHFKHLFEKVYPTFFIQLRNTAPDITLAELRVAALSKLQVSTKEAGNLLGISAASVNKTRQRLRSRLGIESDADLKMYFA